MDSHYKADTKKLASLPEIAEMALKSINLFRTKNRTLISSSLVIPVGFNEFESKFLIVNGMIRKDVNWGNDFSVPQQYLDRVISEYESESREDCWNFRTISVEAIESIVKKDIAASALLGSEGRAHFLGNIGYLSIDLTNLKLGEVGFLGIEYRNSFKIRNYTPLEALAERFVEVRRR